MAMAEPARVNILLVLPVIDFAAPLITFGYLYGRFNGIPSEKLSVESFRQLPRGTALVFYSPTGPRRAVFEGITECSGIECVKVRVEHKDNRLLKPLSPESQNIVRHICCYDECLKDYEAAKRWREGYGMIRLREALDELVKSFKDLRKGQDRN